MKEYRNKRTTKYRDRIRLFLLAAGLAFGMAAGKAEVSAAEDSRGQVTYFVNDAFRHLYNLSES